MSTRQELHIFNIGGSKNTQRNYAENTLRMPTYRIPRKPFDYHPKERTWKGRPLKRWKNPFD